MSNFVPNNGVFDANQFEPNQGGSKHPIGNFPFVIKNTQILASQDRKSGMLRVTFESPAGTIDRNYNLWHENQQTVEIRDRAIPHKKVTMTGPNGIKGEMSMAIMVEGATVAGKSGSMPVS